jgi:hypothetical protein
MRMVRMVAVWAMWVVRVVSVRDPTAHLSTLPSLSSWQYVSTP